MFRQEKKILKVFPLAKLNIKSHNDTEITLEGDRNSFERTVKIIDTFVKKSGLLLHAGKTSTIWLGSN